MHPCNYRIQACLSFIQHRKPCNSMQPGGKFSSWFDTRISSTGGPKLSLVYWKVIWDENGIKPIGVKFLCWMDERGTLVYDNSLSLPLQWTTHQKSQEICTIALINYEEDNVLKSSTSVRCSIIFQSSMIETSKVAALGLPLSAQDWHGNLLMPSTSISSRHGIKIQLPKPYLTRITQGFLNPSLKFIYLVARNATLRTNVGISAGNHKTESPGFKISKHLHVITWEDYLQTCRVFGSQWRGV